MHLKRITAGTCIALVLALSFAVGSTHVSVFAQSTQPTANVAVEPQYDTTHVYVAPDDFDRFVASVIATFGGTKSKQGVFTVTPTPSSTMSQLVRRRSGRCPCSASEHQFHIPSDWSAPVI